MLSAKTVLADALDLNWIIKASQKKKKPKNINILTEQIGPNGHLEFKGKTNMLQYVQCKKSVRETIFRMLAKKMDLGHTNTFKILEGGVRLTCTPRNRSST